MPSSRRSTCTSTGSTRTSKWKDEVHFEGRAVFKSPNLAYLDFWKLKLTPNAKGQLAPANDPKNGKPLTTPTETIVCSRNEVWQYLYEGRQIFVFPLAKGERQRALDEGPLPFLFNMKAEEAGARYQMLFEGENTENYAVKVVPGSRKTRSPSRSAFLYLDKKYLLPERIALISPDGKSSRDFGLHDIKANTARSNDDHLQGGRPPKGVEGGQKAPDRVPAAGECRRAGRAGRAGCPGGDSAARAGAGAGVAWSRGWRRVGRGGDRRAFDRPPRRAYNHPGKPLD